MDNLTKVGGALLAGGILSFLLSLVGLEFRSMSFLGENKIYVEIAFVVVGIIILIIAKKRNQKTGEE